MEENKEQKVQFSDYMYILFKWKRIIFIALFITIAVSTIISFSLPITYKSMAVVTIPPESSMGLSGLTSLLGGGKSSSSIGAKLFGTSNTSEDMLLGFLNSRGALEKVINKYSLMEYYEIDDKNMDKAIKAFAEDLVFEPNEFGFIQIIVINQSPQKCADMANYFVSLADSLNRVINTEAARNNRLFIEQRYNKNLVDLKNVEDSLYRFQKKYGIFAVPEQLEVSVKAAAEIESELVQKEISMDLLKMQFGENSPQVMGLQSQINLLKGKVKELKNSKSLSSESNVLFAFNGIPDLMIQYLRLYRNVEIQSKILEVMLPMYEQARVEENKSVPTLLFVDPAVPPQIKYGPKKAYIISACTFIVLFFSIIFAFRAEKIYNMVECKNPLLLTEKKYYSSVVKIFRLKI